MKKIRLSMQVGVGWVRRYWPGIIGGLLLVLVLIAGSPAWAAPATSELNQTVPDPTATPGDKPVATPTARPDRDDDEGQDFEATAEAPLEGEKEGNTTVFLFKPAARGDLTAVVTVANLNMREGPGTQFAVVGAVAPGTVLDVLARNEQGSWWYVCCAPDGATEGWVSAQLVEPDFDRVQAIELVPLFGAPPPPTPESQEEPVQVKQPVTTGGLPLVLTVSQSPPFVWQGQGVSLEFVIANPNSVDIRNVELSDELPSALQFVDAEADTNGRLNQRTTRNGATLVLVTWPTLQAGGAVAATISVIVSPDLPNAAVIDNLAAVRADNGEYTTGGISIGMPPVELPDFQ